MRSPRFTITKNSVNEFIFTVKKPRTIEPTIITAGDTFTAEFIRLSDGVSILKKTLGISSETKAVLTLTVAETQLFESRQGSFADRYYLIPLYKLKLDFHFASIGDVITTIGKVYVK
jgi:hypothetical protein